MDGRLEKIRRFEGNIMDFDIYLKDRIEQTKKENKKKKVCESSAYLDWDDSSVKNFVNSIMGSNGIGCEVSGGKIMNTEIGDIPYTISQDRKTLNIVLPSNEEAQQVANFDNYKFIDNDYEITTKDNVVYVHITQQQ